MESCKNAITDFIQLKLMFWMRQKHGVHKSFSEGEQTPGPGCCH